MNKIIKFPRIIFCKENEDTDIFNKFRDSISSLAVENIFNPSFYIDGDLQIFSFRAIKKGEKNINSFLIIKDKNKEELINISEKFCKQFGVEQLIDPKITKLNNELYITFNSGWNPEGNNVFIMKIYPEMESPKKIIYNNRKQQERNWDFFSKEGEIYALYWINPLKILKLKNKSEDSWEFEDYYSVDEHEAFRKIPKDLTIGTQLYKKGDKYYFIAHKKIFFFRKKIYFGKFCSFDIENKKIKIGKSWLIHSFKSLFGSKIKHNTNLFSCTYFSGLQISGDVSTLGYGVNDIEPSFSKHKIEELID